VNPALPPASPLTATKTTVPAGQFGVVRSTGYGDPPDSVLALKVGVVHRGQPGELKDVSSLTGGTEAIQTAAPYYVNVHYAVLQGDPGDSPVRGIGAEDSRRGQGAIVLRLNADSDLKRCSEPGTATDQDPPLRSEQVDCVVMVFEDPEAEPDQVTFVDDNGVPTGAKSRRFTIGAIS
jgi:hypothetical protein